MGWGNDNNQKSLLEAGRFLGRRPAMGGLKIVALILVKDGYFIVARSLEISEMSISNILVRNKKFFVVRLTHP